MSKGLMVFVIGLAAAIFLAQVPESQALLGKRIVTGVAARRAGKTLMHKDDQDTAAKKPAPDDNSGFEERMSEAGE